MTGLFSPGGAALVGVGLAVIAAHARWLLPRGSWRQRLAVAIGGTLFALMAAFSSAGMPGAWLLLGGVWLVVHLVALRRPPAAEPVGGTRDAAPDGPPVAPASPGDARRQFGIYRIDRAIGRGAMGAVYLAHEVQSARPVALKTLALGRDLHGTALEEARRRFFREAETAQRLHHPDIVAVHAAGEADGLAYIAMEFVPGDTLAGHVAPGRLLAPADAVAIVARVADALDHAHRQGVVHRDVKPANILVEPAAGRVKVMDFGIARVADASRTVTGVWLGTPSYMSPEQMSGAPVDGRSDQYALGVVLFQLLTGRLPYGAESMGALMRQIATEPAPDLRDLRPDLPAPLADVLARALAKPPAARHPTAAAFAVALRAVLPALDTGPAVADVMPSPDSAVIDLPLEPPGTEPMHNSRL